MAARRYRLRRRYRRRAGRRSVGAAVAAGLLLAAAAHASHHPSHHHHAQAPAAAAPVSGPAAATISEGRRQARRRGWGHGAQWRCLDALWTRESGWSATATNPRTGAYGIAQALGHGPTGQYPAGPANPPASDPAAQIRWGLAYIAAVYGSPCAAWAHELSDSWY